MTFSPSPNGLMSIPHFRVQTIGSTSHPISSNPFRIASRTALRKVQIYNYVFSPVNRTVAFGDFQWHTAPHILRSGCLPKGTLGDNMSRQSGRPFSRRLFTSFCSHFWNSFTEFVARRSSGNMLYTAASPNADLVTRGDFRRLLGSHIFWPASSLKWS